MKNKWILIATIIFSGFCFYFSSYYRQVWPLAWFAPVFVLVYGYKNSLFKTATVSFFAYASAEVNLIIGYFSLSPQAFIVQSLQETLIWVLVILVSCGLVKKIKNPFSILIYPTCFALMEWLKASSSFGTFSSLAGTQLKLLSLMQLAPITGIIGVGFIVSLFAASLAHVIAFWAKRVNALCGFGLGISIVLAVFIFSQYQLSVKAAPKQEFKVGLVSIYQTPEYTLNPSNAFFILSHYQLSIEKLANAGAKVILLPEEVLRVNANQISLLMNKLSQLASSKQIYLMMGVREEKESHLVNSVWLFSPQGKLIGKYHKRHLVPYMEKMLTPEITLLPFDIDGIDSGVAICRDMDYPDPAADYGKLKTQILFVPSWDFVVDAELHRKGALLESIQNGYTLVRVAREGDLSVSTPQGIIVAEQRFSGKTDVLLVNAPIYANTSFYAQHSHWFISVLFVLLVIFIVVALVKCIINK